MYVYCLTLQNDCLSFLLSILIHLGLLLPPPPAHPCLITLPHSSLRIQKQAVRISLLFITKTIDTRYLSRLFPAYHLTLRTRNPCSYQGQTLQLCSGVYLQYFMSIVPLSLASSVSWIISSTTHYHVLVSSIFHKTLLLSQIPLIPQ